MKREYDIAEHGACPDGKTLNTRAIQGAIDACHRAGGGRVACGAGVFLTGSLELKSNVELYLGQGCRLKGSPRLEDYPPFEPPGFVADRSPEKSRIALIRAANAEDFALAGPGTVDGSGLAFYDTSREGKLDKPPTPRPRIGMFYRCRSFRVEDVTLVDSPCWTLWLMQCDGGRVSRVHIRGDRRMRNVDGIDIDASRNITVSDCRMDTEDDCLVLRNIRRLYESDSPCENVTVTNCVLKSGCQGVRVGCPNDGVIRNCTFSNLVIESSGNGITFQNPHRYLSAGETGSAHVTDITFSNIVINCCRYPVWILVEEGIALSRLANLAFRGLVARSGGPCLVQGCPETTVEDVSFSDMTLETSGEDAVIFRHCRNARLSGLSISNRAPERPAGGKAAPGGADDPAREKGGKGGGKMGRSTQDR